MAPFSYRPFEDRFSGTIAEIMSRRGDIAARSGDRLAQGHLRRGQIESEGAIRQGDIAARSASERGQIVSGAISGITQALAGIPGQIQHGREQAQQEKFRAAQITDIEAQAEQRRAAATKQKTLETQNAYIDKIMQTSMKDDPETGVSSFDRTTFEQGLIGSGMGHLYPSLAETLDKLDASASKRNTESRAMVSESLVGVAKLGYTHEAALGAAAFLKKNRAISDDQLNTALDALADDPSPAGVKRVVDGLGQNLKGYQDWASNEQKRTTDLAKTVAETDKITADAAKARAEAAGTLPPTPAQAETARHNRELEKIGTLTAGRAEASAAETARHNRAMEESARNRVTARPVLSGDANRLAEIDTSIEQLHGLKGLKTGVGSQLAADWVPNFVTEWTGVGAESKGRLALIDTVKQIIGKGLEGGVLRKEDEIKYAKILPRIGDPPDVAAEKIKGLDSALKTKKEQTLEALEDAGFNVTNFRARAAKAPPADVEPPKGAPAKGTTRAGATWDYRNGQWGWWK